MKSEKNLGNSGRLEKQCGGSNTNPDIVFFVLSSINCVYFEFQALPPVNWKSYPPYHIVQLHRNAVRMRRSCTLSTHNQAARARAIPLGDMFPVAHDHDSTLPMLNAIPSELSEYEVRISI
jgi:hypothetical protein